MKSTTNNAVFIAINYAYSCKYLFTWKLRSETDAEDLIQDVQERIWKERDSFEGKDIKEQKKIINAYFTNRRIDLLRQKFTSKRIVDTRYIVKYQKPEAYSIMQLKEVKTLIKGKVWADQILKFAEGYTIKELQQDLLDKNLALSRNFNARVFLKKMYK